MKTVHLVLKYKWYDKIDCGEKRVEYRDNTPYWHKRLADAKRIVFHRGYTKKTMTFMVDMKVFTSERIALHLGDRL